MAEVKEQKIPQVEVERPLELKLEPWPIDDSLIVSGKPAASGVLFHKSADGKSADGVWECTPGSFNWNYTWNETVYLLKGRMSITPEGEQPIHAQAGDVVHFAQGLKAKLEITDTVRKVFFLNSDEPLKL